jgi:hypothetical protein
MSMRADSRIPSFPNTPFRVLLTGFILGFIAAGSSLRADCPPPPATQPAEEVV